MGNLLQKGAAWLCSQRHNGMSSPVTYVRDGASIQINATFGRRIYPVSDGHGATVNIESFDFIVRATDLVDNGEKFEPENGDYILVPNTDEDAFRYDVMPLVNEKCWRYADEFSNDVRIHTKMIGVDLV